MSKNEYEPSFIIMLSNSIQKLGDSIENRNYKKSFEIMQFILSVLEPEDREDNKEFIAEIDSALFDIDNTHGRNWNYNFSIQISKARSWWRLDNLPRLMKIIWDGRYLIKQKYESFYDTSEGRKSKRE